MRILHVNHALTVGGAEVMILELAREQRRAGHELAVCSMYGVGPLDTKAAAMGVPVFHLNSGRSLGAKVRALTAHLRAHPVDILNSHWAVWLPTALAGWRTGIPRVHTYHGNESRRSAIEQRFAVPLTQAVVGLIPALDDYILKWVGVPRRKLTVIPNGIDLARMQSGKAAVLAGVPADAPVIVMVARFSPPKDYDTYIRAAKIVTEQNLSAHLLAVGDGVDRSRMEALASELGIPRLHFLGARHDIPDLLSRSVIAVLASRNEGLGIAAIEAMAAGAVCVASDIPALNYVLESGRCGVLVPGRDPAALAAAILGLLDDPARREELRARAAERYPFFSGERMTADYLALYERVLESFPRARSGKLAV